MPNTRIVRVERSRPAASQRNRHAPDDDGHSTPWPGFQAPSRKLLAREFANDQNRMACRSGRFFRTLSLLRLAASHSGYRVRYQWDRRPRAFTRSRGGRLADRHAGFPWSEPEPRSTGATRELPLPPSSARTAAPDGECEIGAIPCAMTRCPGRMNVRRSLIGRPPARL